MLWELQWLSGSSSKANATTRYSDDDHHPTYRKPCGGFHHKPVLENFSLAIKHGDFVGLKGLNGSGKTTLLKTLSGLLTPINGKVFIQGKDIHRTDIQTRATLVSIVLTERIRLRGLRVRDLVEMGLYPTEGAMHFNTKENSQKIDESLERMRITHLADKSLTDISDGELQKTMIARALTQATPLIIMDEPTAFLDYVAREEFYTLMSTLCRDTGVAVLISSHDVGMMERWVEVG
ncbi:MAG: ABC transporter ATP-binding protein [Flavobacteriales bacterium]|nr:ABC transporter ATP-binding protein [Flavobacteriales bacterium]